MSEWQPIETAPKDGTEFLVFMQDEPHSQWIQTAYFEANGNLCDYNGHLCVTEFATHWMPLPPTPEAT